MRDTRIARRWLAGVIVTGLASAGAVLAQPPSSSPAQAAKPTIVLVHGAFADGTGWQHVIPILQRDGFTVIAVQNPLSSFASDVQTTKRVLDAQQGPVVLVGHSYGGAVITEAASGIAHVKALVYVAALAPDAGEAVGAFNEKYPSQAGPAFRPDAAGFLYIDPAQFHDLFAADVPAAQARVMAAAQKPLIASSFGETVSQPAWKTIPSWYVVAQQDRIIDPELERFLAKRMGAKTTEIKSSHVPFISHPKEIARLIEEAAGAAAK